MPGMTWTSLRGQLGLVAAGYTAVLAAGALLIYQRHRMYVQHAQEAAAAGGMYAAGDLLLGLMIACMLLVPTGFLALVIRKSEALYDGYAKLLFALSLTAPLSLGILSIPVVSEGTGALGWICMCRLLGSPVMIVGCLASRLLAPSDRAKRLTLYALLIEVLTLLLTVGLFLFVVTSRH
jgi:hypothetical protein